MEEATLVEEARRGDDAAFEALVTQYRALMVRVAYLITASEAEAEDATQEALTKAYRALPRFRAGAAFRPWLLRIVANEAKNRRKASLRRAALAARADPPEPEPGPDRGVILAEERAALREALAGLRSEDRQVVAYRYLLELNETETAEALGWPRGTVKSRLSRALARLRSSAALRAYLAVALLGALLAALIVASPELRSAVADRLGITGVDISHVPDIAVPDGRSVDLGVPLTLEEARQRTGYELRLPGGHPADRVFLAEDVPGGRVSHLLTVGDREVLLMQLRGDLLGGAIAGKGIGPDTRMRQVTVNGQPGVWLEGAPHAFFLRDGQGQVRSESVRLAGNVLLWESAPYALRLEGPLSLDEALGLAATIR